MSGLGESTPLLGLAEEGSSKAKEKWGKVRAATHAGIAFRRTKPAPRPALGRGPAGRRVSVRGSLAFPFYPSAVEVESESEASSKPVVEPVQALSPLVRGGKISGSDGTVLAKPHPASIVKSVPAYTPYSRKARHRNFHIWWLNEFRHWWKSSRLLVRLGGLETLALEMWTRMVVLSPFRFK